MDLPTFSSGRLVGAAAIAFTGALALAAATAATASLALGVAAAAGTPSCTTSGLVAWLETPGNGTAGSIYYNLELTNLSGHTCTLRGYPGVSAVDLSGHRLGSAASRDTSTAPRLVRLARGATATAVLRIVNTGVFSRSACRPVTAAGLRVHPPNQTASKVVPFPFGACSRTGLRYLSVRTVQKP